MLVVTCFIRANPPTVGHLKLLKTLHDTSKERKGDAILFTSQSHDSKKNPIPYDEKVVFLESIIAENGLEITIYDDKDAKTMMYVPPILNEMGYDELIFVGGSDRVPEFTSVLKKYNDYQSTKPELYYNFNSIEIVSSGERDADGDEVSAMSASKMRAYVKDGNKESFFKGLPTKDPTLAEDIWNSVESNLA